MIPPYAHTKGTHSIVEMTQCSKTAWWENLIIVSKKGQPREAGQPFGNGEDQKVCSLVE